MTLRKAKKSRLLAGIAKEVADLTSSPLYAYRVKNNFLPVMGEGDPDADLMCIGEAPGLTEAKTGRPFCGAAGKVLDRLLASISLNRADVYITSVVKDRPPDNRDPLPREIALYAPFLFKQIEIIRPRVIALLGRHAMATVLPRFGLADHLRLIGRLHGQPLAVKASWGALTVIPLYHPAAALYNGSLYPVLAEDFQALKKAMRTVRSGAVRSQIGIT